MKNIIYFIFLTIFFSFAILFIKTSFIEEKTFDEIEDVFIEPEVELDPKKSNASEEKEKIKINTEKRLKERIKQAKEKSERINEELLNSASKFEINFFPVIVEKELASYTNLVSEILNNAIFSDKLYFLSVELHHQLITVRGKMKNKTIKMFGVPDLSKGEFISVFIHELGHYYDLYYLEKKVFTDPSSFFYDISWQSSKVVKKGEQSKDFVSGYAMTNKYEDLAESFIYYVLHNNDFLERTKKSESLKKKYNFFRTYVFKDSDFEKTDFSEGNKIKNYYWDMTKIEIDYENFLQYINK